MKIIDNGFTNLVSLIFVIMFLSGERYVYKFVCDPDALFNMSHGTQADYTNKLHKESTGI